MTARCVECLAPIWWALTTGGKRMPMDPEPDARGNLVLVAPDGTPLGADQARRIAAGARTVAMVTVARRGARSMAAPEGPQQLPLGDEAMPVDARHPEPVLHWRAHWATCPKADRVRQRRGTAR